MAESNALINYEVQDDIGFLALNNPPVNILTQAMMDQISDTLETVRKDTSLKALAITAGGKAFSAGADVGEHKPEHAAGMIGSFGRMFRLFDGLEIPVVMAVDGAALGAGFELILMADVLIATEQASFGQPEIMLGFFAPVGVAELPARVGRAKAMEITCSGRSYSARQMFECGIVSEVVDEGGLFDALEKVLKSFRRTSPLVMRLNVRALKRSQHKPFVEALDEAEKSFLEDLMTSEDPVEGIASFYEKRRPEWKNR